VLGGCQYVTIQSGQLSAVIKALSPDSKVTPAFFWTVQYGGYSAKVQPVIVEKSTVFVNNIDSIVFNGWSITNISGVSSFTPAWEIRDSGRERSFVVQGQIVATHQCDPWLKTNVEYKVRFEQHCTGKKAYTNTILVDSLGQITDIEQVVDSSFMVLRLRLNN
tara:strand:- start:731 stop:1219 length:489 start_codon:yes stop_codon:yes gene_type:complete